MLNLCKSYHCIDIDYRIDKNNIAELKEYKITYNCIGWAFGIHDWINPILSTLNTSNIALLENKVKGFLNLNLKIYQKPEKQDSLVYNVIKNIKSIYCDKDSLSKDELYKDGAIAFYFKNDVMQHAARYVTIFDGQEIKAWTSKLGQNIMISHELSDLSGDESIYGFPLCYALPEPSIQSNFSNLISIDGEI